MTTATITSNNSNHRIRSNGKSSINTMKKCNSHSLMLVVSTALITWMISTLFCQSKYSSILYFSQQQQQESLHQPLQRGSFYSSSRQSSKTTSLQDKNAISDTATPKKTKDDKNLQTPPKKKLWVQLPNETYKGPSRVWNQWKEEFPCVYPGDDETRLMVTTPAHEGLLFQRPEKTGTTTMVGVVMRLAHNRAAAALAKQGDKQPASPNLPTMAAAANNKNNNSTAPHVSSRKNFQFCKHRAMHGTAVKMEYHLRDRKKSFLFSVIRDPTAKAISRFFHFV